MALLDTRPIMGVIDIRNYFPSVRRHALEVALGRMPVPDHSFEALLDWLDELGAWGVHGLPTGHDPSRVVADGLLAECDAVFGSRIPFIRYVDDTWFYVNSPEEFDDLVGHYRSAAQVLELELHPEKTQFYEAVDALEIIESQGIAYFGELLREPGEEGLHAALELFEYALEDPGPRKSDLRMALDALADRAHLRPLETLREDRELLAYAPEKWIGYLRALRQTKRTRRIVDDDWLISEVTSACGENEAFRQLVFLRAAAGRQLSKDHGRLLLELTASNDSWTEPIRVWAAYIWGQSEAFNPNTALELLEDRGGYATQRAFAMTLSKRMGNKRSTRWVKRVRRADEELEATAAWLEAA